MKTVPLYMQPVQPGGLLGLIQPTSLPPAEAPYPVLNDSDVNEPPLPSVEAIAPTPSNTAMGAPSPASNRQPKLQSVSILATMMFVFISALLI